LGRDLAKAWNNPGQYCTLGGSATPAARKARLAAGLGADRSMKAGGGAALECADEAIVAERPAANLTAFDDRAEHRSGGDRGGGQPRLQRLHEAQMGAALNGDFLLGPARPGPGDALDHHGESGVAQIVSTPSCAK
jgi:hypothetical protein